MSNGNISLGENTKISTIDTGANKTRMELHLNNKKVIAVAISAVAAFSSVPAHAQFMGIFQGVMSATNQITGKLGNRMMGGEKPVNIEEEKTKFYSGVQKQMESMDEPTKRLVMNNVDSKWPMVEASFLMRNAQAYRAKNSPLLDLKRIAMDAMGGVALQSNIGRAALGDAGLGGMLKGAALDGIVGGVGGRPSGFNATQARAGAANMGAMAVGGTPSVSAIMAGVSAPVAGAVSNAVSGAIATGVRSVTSNTGEQAMGPEYEISESNHPLVFFEKHPQDWAAKDLYRENGNIGWKQIEASADKTAEAYTPVAGDDFAKVAVFNIEPSTGRVNAAFRILSVAPADFVRVVMAVSKKLQAQPRYASQGNVLRAVWENGAFVAADTGKVTAGWSSLVPQTYRDAQTVVASK